MKIRSGFVSNSSSSSFVCITTPGKIDEMLKNEDETTQKIVKSYLSPRGMEKIKLGGNTYHMWQFELSTEEFGCDCGLDEDEYDYAYDKWNDFTAKLGKEKDCVVSDRC